MITLNINKKNYNVDVDPETPLLWVLRDVINLVGTKYGCGVAQCGACVVHLNGEAVRSCVTKVSRAEGKKVVTIEGLSEKNDHPLQKARILLFLYVLGWANIKNGVLRIKHLLTRKEDRKKFLTVAIHKLKKQWFLVSLNIIGFLLIAWTINFLIDLLAYETCLYLSLKTDGILAESSSEWTILLFFKNLTVIPLTLIFDTVLLLWLANKLSGLRKIDLV